MENEMNRPPATPEEIWAILHSVSERLDKMAAESEQRQAEAEQWRAEVKQWQKEADQRRAEEAEQRQKEARERADRWQKESEQRQKEAEQRQKEAEQRQEEADQCMEELGGLFTTPEQAMVENLVEGDLIPLLRSRNIEVRSTYQGLNSRKYGKLFWFHLLAANDDKEVVVVEVRPTLHSEDVTDFLERLVQFREYVSIWKDNKVLGAVAYQETDTSAPAYAQQQGLFVIRARGRRASIINEADFQPKVFC